MAAIDALADGPLDGADYVAPSLMFVLVTAIAVMIAGSLSALIGLHFAPVFGIDDANITHIYARNIAQGFGYVFNRGGEHVEGSTSPLWTAINALVFLLPGPKPQLLLALCIAITSANVFCGLTLAADLARLFKVQAQAAVLVSGVLLACTPTFFAWNVWSLMDVAPWSLECVLLALVASRLGRSGAVSSREGVALSALAVATTVTRPEAIAVVGLVLVATAGFQLLGRRPGWKRLVAVIAVALVAAVASDLILTILREAYFGYPFPNTYYAKVSTNHLSGLVSGLWYVVHSAYKMPIMDLGALACLGLTIVTLAPGAKPWIPERLGGLAPIAPVLAMGLGVIAVTILEGGDHFSDERFIQPLTPIFAATVAVFGLYIACRSWKGAERPGIAALSVFAVASCGLYAVSLIAYRHYQASIEREFVISNRGRAFAAILNDVTKQEGPASVGVIAAGGLPMDFNGRAYDLEGLNWVAMAHANPLKIGPKDHASFDAATFYAARPDLVVLDYYEFAPNDKWIIGAFHVQALKGILYEPKFRNEYKPILIDVDGRRIGVIASDAWIARAKVKAFRIVPWDQIQLLTQL